MKNYLGLVSEYAKVHKKKNRLTMICIAISVMLVTAVFGMADTSLKAQKDEAIRRYGNWHTILSDVSLETARAIDNRNDVSVSGFLGMASSTITYQGKELIIQSSNEELAEQMNVRVTQGHYPATETQALLDRQGLEQFGLSIGDPIEIIYSGGQTRQYQISGTYADFSSLKGDDAHGLLLTEGGLRFLPETEYQEYDYIQFKDGTDIIRVNAEIKAEYGLTDEQIQTNVMLLGFMGQSRDTSMLGVYLTAIILFILVAMAGIFMIAGSFNMSVLERTQFFGLLRCLGATRRQIKRYIRREGMLFCLKAIPVGLFFGSVILWIAIFVLNSLNSQYLPQMQQFPFSIPGILAGVAIGILVVMLSSGTPAKNAAKVSPQTAVTGNINQTNNQNFKKASNTKIFRVDTAMGLRHAFSNRKGMILIAGSFAVSIVLFLCFTILVTFMNHALSPLKPYAPDLTIVGNEQDIYLPHSLKEEIMSVSGVEKVYGRMFYTDIPAKDKKGSNTATLVSYDDPQFAWADDVLISGDIENVQNGSGVLVDYGYSQEFHWEIGDTITLDMNGTAHEITVSGIVSDVPFDSGSGEWIIVCSENTFMSLTGTMDYKVIDIQAGTDISDQIRGLITSDMKLLDKRQHNEEVRTGYFAMAVFVYGFLLVIALVAFINIINTVNTSVSSRINHYNVMRAVGMSGKQLQKVILAEAAAYAVTGSIAGAISGLFLHRFFFEMLITSNWGQKWAPPVTVLAAVVMAVIFTTLLAVISLKNNDTSSAFRSKIPGKAKMHRFPPR